MMFPDVYRSMSLGFDEMFQRLDDFTKSTKTLGYPPYNILKVDENKYIIELAVAGFGKQDIEIELKDSTLVVSGKINSENTDKFYYYKGIADRAFTRTFKLADTVEIQNAQLINGMLKVWLENIIPEHKKPKKIEIKEEDEQDKKNSTGLV